MTFGHRNELHAYNEATRYKSALGDRTVFIAACVVAALMLAGVV